MISEEPADLQATIEQTDSGEQQYVLRALCDHLSGIREELSGIRTLLEASHAASEAMRGQAQAYLEAQQARTQEYLEQVQIEPEPDFYPFVELPVGTEPRDLPDGNRLFTLPDGMILRTTDDQRICVIDGGEQQGITPGPNIFFENTTVVYGIFGSLIMCDILLYVIAKLGFRVWVRITQLPKHIIFSTVTIFAFVGTYSINQNLFDILCLILFGILGYGMRRFQFPAGPMIIGFILGPLLESAFDQTMTLSDGSFMIFLTHPFSVVLLLLTVAAVFSIARARLRRSKIAQLAQEG